MTSALYRAYVLSSKIFNYLLVFIIANSLYLWWAEFHSIFCRPFLQSVLIMEGVGGVGSGTGWSGTGRSGRWQKPPPGTPHEQPWIPHSGQWHPHNGQWHPHSGQWHTSKPHIQWEQIQVPTAQSAPSIVPAMTLEDRQNALQKSGPVNI